MISRFTMFAAGLATGAIAAAIALPAPTCRADCELFKVRQKVATAYVLKPPPAPAPEHLFCPSPIVEKPVVEEPKAEEPAVEEEKPRRHRHMRRHRRYW